MAEGEVLIVDDNPNNLELLGDVLRGAGYRVRGAADGPQALKIAQARAPDLVLLDLQMPGMDGYEACRRMKADPATRDIPVIVISALDDVDDKVKAFEAGAVDYVTKPFEAPEVLSRVGAHLQLFRLHRDLERRNQELVQAQARTERVFSALAAALPGTVLDGRYRLEHKIGVGAFGTVFKAEQLGLKRPVAVKVFRPWDGSENPVALERFRREGASACRVNHPNAVAILDCGISSSGIAYLVMELLEGQTVFEMMKDAPPTPARTAQIVAPVCAVLAEAHRSGVVHRDIKPENVFLHRGPSGEVVKVLDFGIAKLIGEEPEEDAPQLTRGFVGTPRYAAPERLLSKDYDGSADVFSVGVMLYRMLSGRWPFEFGKSESVLAAALRNASEAAPPLATPGVPAPLEGLVMRALAKEPAERPSAEEMAALLATVR